MKAIGKYYEARNVYQSLYGHTYDALAFLKEYIHKEWKIIETFCGRWELSASDLVKSLYLTVLLHDVGKLTETFQKNIIQGKHTPHMPHPLMALVIIYDIFESCFPKLIDEIEPSDMECTAILTHHTQAYRDLYLSIDCRSNYKSPDAISFMDQIIHTYQELGFNEYFPLHISIDNPEVINRKSDQLKNAVEGVKQRISETTIENKSAIKALFTFIFSLLKMSDIFSSMNFTEQVDRLHTVKDGSVYDEMYLPNNTISFISMRDHHGEWQQKRRRAFQEKLYKDQHLYTMLFAPCGRGKTDAALYWALGLINKNMANRIIFALPTQVTCNAMYEKFITSTYFSSDKIVGLYHGRSLQEITIHGKEPIDDEMIDSEQYKKLISDKQFKAEIFFQPITVTTIDHLLYAFIHGYKKADFTLGNVQTSAIIFDEIHYYDNTMLSHLRQLFSILREMQIPHLLMSGTFPDFLKKEINVNGDYEWIEDSEGLKYTPFVIIKKEEESLITDDRFNYEVLNEIMDGYKKKMKQFIILNSILSSQIAYIQIKKELIANGFDHANIILLHSRFLYEDRREIEQKIRSYAKPELLNNNIPFILIATQVVEISLDISSHKLYTEYAPVDALGQRGGRVNRGGMEPDHKQMIIYMPPTSLPYDDKLLNDSMQSLKEGITSYMDFKISCDMVYKEKEIQHSTFRELFKECTLFGHSPSEIRWNEEQGKIFKTREEKYQTIDVYPIFVFYDIGCHTFKDSCNVLKVPLWWYYKDKSESSNLFVTQQSEDKEYILCKLDYSKEIGLASINSPFEAFEKEYPHFF